MTIRAGALDTRLTIEAPPASVGGAWTSRTKLWASSEVVPGPDPLTGSAIGMVTYRMKAPYQSTVKTGMRGITSGRTRYFADVRDPDGRRAELDIVAVELVSENLVTLTRQVPGAKDPLTDRRTPGSTSSATSAAFAVTPSAAERTRYQANSWDVQKTITLVLVAAQLGAFEPAPDDVVTWGSLAYGLREIEPIGQATVPLFYRVVGTR